MNGVVLINKPFNWAYEIGRKQITENRRLVAVTFLATTAFIAITLIYRRLQQSDVLPFNRWTVTLGLSTQVSLTPKEAQNLEASSQLYTPTEFARRLYAYMLQNPNFLDQSSAGNAHLILPSPHESLLLTIEDEKAFAIQNWAMSLQPLFALLKENPLPWKELLQPIQSSPRLAYTILFNCLAPFAAQGIWKGLQDVLPTSIQEMGNRYLEHKGKIALICIGLIIWLYHRMNQEKGIITNLTENFATSHRPHRGLDLVPCYRKGIDELLRSIGMSTPGQPSANLIWYYPKNTHSTFVGEIGEVLAEMTATGRIYDNSILFSEFPQLKNLQVVEFNVNLFLIEYRDKDEVYRGWHETMKHVAKSPNILVVLTDIDAIKPYLLPSDPMSRDPDGQHSEPRSSSHETPSEKILSNLIILSLQQGKLRCLLELDESEKARMEQGPKIFRLFSATRAPNIDVKELEDLCERLYTSQDISSPFTKEDIAGLFGHLRPTLTETPIPPLEIMDTIQETLATRARSWRHKVKDLEGIKKIEKAERNLQEAHQVKELILQKLWQQRRLRQTESKPLSQAALLLQHRLIPAYKKTVADLKNQPLEPANLVTQMQKRFVRLFGPCTKEEEKRLQTLPERLKQKIKGQDAAVDKIAEAVYRWRTVPLNNGKPLVLFFAGASGIGKSETATHLAYELNFTYGITDTAVKTHESNVKRINLNRDKQGGFLGWDKIKAEILRHLLHTPTSVIILEEWDKMGLGEKTCLLELLDGTQNYLQMPWSISSTNGPFVDKSCATIILTSNIEIGASQDFLTSVETTTKSILSAFGSEKGKEGLAFLSRVDRVIPFQEISQKASQDLIKAYLDDYVTKGTLPADKRPAVESRLSQVTSTDARELQRLVQDAIFKELLSQ